MPSADVPRQAARGYGVVVRAGGADYLIAMGTAGDHAVVPAESVMQTSTVAVVPSGRPVKVVCARGVVWVT
jgi:hypothetical protein